MKRLFFTLFFLPFYLLAAVQSDRPVYMGILIQNQDQLISYFLRSIDNLDYDKKNLHVQFDVCNESKEVQKTVSEWAQEHQKDYKKIEVAFREKELNGKEGFAREEVFAKIKKEYLKKTIEFRKDYCFILSSDTFLLPKTLRHLVEQDKPIISPMLRPIPEPIDSCRNFFADVTEDGGFKDHPDYPLIAYRKKKGTFQVPSLSSAYLIDLASCKKLKKSKQISSISKSALENGIEQFICNEKEFGFFLHFAKPLTLGEEKAFNLVGTSFEVTPSVLDNLLSKYYKGDSALQDYASHFNFSEYAIYRVKNRDLFYVDEVYDYIKEHVIKQGLEWEEHIHNQFRKYTRPGSIALDIGGHIGTHTLNLSRLVGETGKVYVFEPQAKMFCELAINMHLNKVSNVHMFHNALGSEEKWVEMYTPDEEWKKQFGKDLVNEGHGTVTELPENFTGDRVKVIRLDDLHLNNISLIKMDVEEYEMHVIQGGMETIRRNMPVMIIEIFQNQDRSARIKEIEALGYISAHLFGDDFLFIPLVMIEGDKKEVVRKAKETIYPQKNIHVSWEGTFSDLGSLSNVNRFFTKEIEKIKNITLTCVNAIHPPKARDKAPDVTVRHMWPPNWNKPEGKWVLIQPWEYGAVPLEWIKQLQNVDEIWVPTNFVKYEYVYSGVPEEKIKVVPNGYDPEKFNTNIAPKALATKKKFKFLYLGGTIFRKGIDILVNSYFKAFTADDDVCLVIKDAERRGAYIKDSLGHEIEEIQKRPNTPEILYLDQDMTVEEIASIYRACDCLVAPYRGEGFLLPALEAMACGLPVIVTAGGATSDFVRGTSGWFIPSQLVSLGHQLGSEMPLAKEGWWLEPDADVLSGMLRWTFSNPSIVKEKGEAAAKEAKEWTWKNAAEIASQRLYELTKNL